MTTGRAQPPPTITVPGLDVGAIADVIVDRLEQDRQLTARSIGHGQVLVTRTRRPRRAVLACVLTFWIGGLGFLFLLIRRTESGTIGVRGGPRGCTVTLPALLGPETIADLRRRLEPDTPTAPVTVDFEPSDDLEAVTTPRRTGDLGAATTPRRTDDLGAATTPRRVDDLAAVTTPRRAGDVGVENTVSTGARIR